MANVREEVNRKNYSSINVMPLIKEKERKNKSAIRGTNYSNEFVT